MRIALVNPSFQPRKGGLQRDAFETALGLAELGHHVGIFTEDTSLPSRLCERTEIHLVERTAGSEAQPFARSVERKLDESGPWNIVQSFSRCYAAPVYRAAGGTHACYLATTRKHRSIAGRLFYSVSPKHTRYRRQERAIYTDGGVRIIANSARTKEEIVAAFPAAASRTEVVYPCVDLERFPLTRCLQRRADIRRRLAIDQEALVLLFAGNGYFRKGLRFAMETLASVKRRGIPAVLLVAGKGRPAPYLRLAAQLRIGHAVRFVGLVDDLEELTACADILTHPSLYEPFGLVPLEAMAAGLPALITAACGIGEAVIHERDAFVLRSPEETGYAADVVEYLALNEPARTAIGRNARACAARFSRSRYSIELLRYYDRNYARHPSERGRATRASAR